MVRFIMEHRKLTKGEIMKFTFQYGQIYYKIQKKLDCLKIQIYIPIWLDLLLNTCALESMAQNNLHSNMVRFIIRHGRRRRNIRIRIYIPIWLDLLYIHAFFVPTRLLIYIPIWLDLLYLLEALILKFFIRFTFQYGQIYYQTRQYRYSLLYDIYIPIWLDLLFGRFQQMRPHFLNLHSNMVRFIIFSSRKFGGQDNGFTFQYGQIYYQLWQRQSLKRYWIYIPIWLDLL